MGLLINFLVYAVIWTAAGFGMKWLCDTFFQGFKIAYWICGVILLISLLIILSSQVGGTAQLPKFFRQT